jgi:hypothetical protein
MGEGSLIRPGSWNEAKARARDGSPGNLGDPAHVHVRASRQLGRRLTLTLARKASSDLPGARAQAARHEPRRVAWTPEAKQISDRGCVPRSTSILPVTSGNRTHRDPIEGKRGAMRREPLTGNMGENFGSRKHLSTKRQRLAELARTETREDLRDFFCQRVTDSVIDTTASEALP